MPVKIKKTCAKGHTFYKSSDCPTCPACEAAKKPAEGFLSSLSAPARRALQHENITTLKKLSLYTEKDILALHGVGPSAIPLLRLALQDAGLAFKKS